MRCGAAGIWWTVLSLFINADDFYGREAFRLLHDFFLEQPEDTSKYHYCMAGYLLRNTLTENGTWQEVCVLLTTDI